MVSTEQVSGYTVGLGGISTGANPNGQGSIYDYTHKSYKTHTLKDSKIEDPPASKLNKVHIKVVGKTITVKVDNSTTATATDAQNAYTDGYIGLFARKDSVIAVHSLSLKVLKE